MIKQGKAIMHMLLIWRLHRGAAGTPGAEMLTEVTRRVDMFHADHVARKRRMTLERIEAEEAEKE